MDFTPIEDAVTSKLYSKIADICDDLMLQFSTQGIDFEDEWPYTIHLLGHIYVDDINSARFLWKRMPPAIKERQPEVGAAWKIGQKLWTRDYAAVHEAIRGFEWSQEAQCIVAAFSVLLNKLGDFLMRGFFDNSNMGNPQMGIDLYTKKMFQLLLSAYSTISIQDTALSLGMSEDDATNYVVGQGWTVDTTSRMLTVKKQPIVTEQKLDPSKLQRLTEYVFHLEH